MNFSRHLISALLAASIFVWDVSAEPDPNFHIYLLFGQSNMAGPCNNDNASAAARDPQPEDCDTTSRVKVLAWGDYSRQSSPCGYQMNRVHDQWYTAFPPYHNGHEGIGPADYFGKTLLDSIRDDISIGFVPCALSGQSIDVFMKGLYRQIDSHTQPTIGNGQKLQSGAYEWMVDRAKLAQESGVIKGILLHQGEANSGEGDGWVNKVKQIVVDLKNDLGLDDIPFIAGELIQDPVADQGAKNLNPYVNKIPDQIPNSGVASSEGLTMRSGDTWRLHFSCEGIRELGRRYADEFLKLADVEFVPRKSTGTIHRRVTAKKKSFNRYGSITVYSLDGQVINTFNKTTTRNAMNAITTKGVFFITQKSGNGNVTTTRFIKQ